MGSIPPLLLVGLEPKRGVVIDAEEKIWMEIETDQWIAVEPPDLREAMRDLVTRSDPDVWASVQPDGQVSFQRLIDVLDALHGAGIFYDELA